MAAGDFHIPDELDDLAALAADCGQPEDRRYCALRRIEPLVQQIARQMGSRFGPAVQRDLEEESVQKISRAICHYAPEQIDGTDKFRRWCRRVLYRHGLDLCRKREAGVRAAPLGDDVATSPPAEPTGHLSLEKQVRSLTILRGQRREVLDGFAKVPRGEKVNYTAVLLWKLRMAMAKSVAVAIPEHWTAEPMDHRSEFVAWCLPWRDHEAIWSFAESWPSLGTLWEMVTDRLDVAPFWLEDGCLCEILQGLGTTEANPALWRKWGQREGSCSEGPWGGNLDRTVWWPAARSERSPPARDRRDQEMNASMPVGALCLQLRQMPDPARPEVAVRIFGDGNAAIAHLCDHVLTAPECDGWAVVMPCYEAVLDPGDGEARWHYARIAQETHGTSAQRLYELYSDSIAADAADARRLGWLKTESGVTVTLGTSGVLVIIEAVGGRCRAVTTAFLPGQGCARAVRESVGEPGVGRALRRESSGRSCNHRPGDSPREEQQRQGRESDYTGDERLYYYVFKPAVQFIRNQYHSQYDMLGNRCGNDYALLKEVLPRRSGLKYRDWLSFRAECERGKP